MSCYKVTVHPRPETLPILIPVTISSPRDLANIERAAAADPGYLISVYTYRRSPIRYVQIILNRNVLQIL